MKKDEMGLFVSAGTALAGLARIYGGALRCPASVRIASRGGAQHALRRGFHSHDAWELFAPLRGVLLFETAGQSAYEVRAGHLLLIPPGCLHMAINCLAQAPDLELLLMNLPGEAASYGSLRVGPLSGNTRLTLAAVDLQAWTELLGDAPARTLTRAAEALAGTGWTKQRGLSGLRLVLAAFAEIAQAAADPARPARAVRRAADALAHLQSHYYDAGLSVPRVARAVGMSPSHLASTFRTVYGRSVHQALLDIRLQRARDLLRGGAHSVKEVAALTGWNHPLYFSAAFRRRYGRPPSHWIP